MIHIQPPVVQNWNSLVNKPSILSDNQISWDEIQNKPTTLTGYGITNGQPLGNELTALQSLADTPGFLKKTGNGTYSIDVGSYLSLSGGTVTGALTLESLGYIPFSLVNTGKTGAGLSTRYVFYNMKSTDILGANVDCFCIYSYNNNSFKSIPFVITDTDNVGIGLVNPSTKLQVAGTITTTDMIVSAATPSTSPTTGASRVTGGQGIGGNQYVGGFSSLGGDASHPGVKIKVLTGTTAATQGGIATIAHGVTDSKIISISALVEYGTSSYVTQSHQFSAGYYFDIWTSSGSINIDNHPTSSAAILSKPVKITVIYTA